MRAVMLSLLALVLLAAPVLADWNMGDPYKWVQFPDLTPNGCDVNATLPFVLADDFLCTATGPITDIHLWGSWYHDYLPYGIDPNAVMFTLSIHEDIPAEQSPTGFSMPGAVLWVRQFLPGQFAARLWEGGLQEGWIEPPDYYDPMGDNQCWQYNFEIEPAEAFIQQGSAGTPKVYWLDVQAQPFDTSAFFGWKTSLDHWNDDATWVIGQEPFMGIWQELRYPMGHPYHPQSIDLAFVITTQTIQQDIDFGDAPDPTYPTLLANDGARHVVVLGPPSINFGAQIDWEPNGQPTPNADGDDLNWLQDEDGIAFLGPLQQGVATPINVTVTVTGILDAWVDFNRDGDWADANERIFNNVLIVLGGNLLSFNVPVGATPGPTYARFRFSTGGVASYTGLANNGEVEDYLVHIEGQDWKWIQGPDIGETGIDVCASQPFILADDFRCEAPGRITEIYVWGSWFSDYLPFGGDPGAVDFVLSIHADIPGDTLAGIPSRPGEVLWVHPFPTGTFSYAVWMSQIMEGWMDPPDLYMFPADWTCWIYGFMIPPEEAFHQVGMPDENVVYWLDVEAIPHDPGARFGWKTSLDHWNDDAAWGQGMEPYHGPWTELRYPPQHQWFPQSIDLAFALRSTWGTDVPEGAAPEPYGLFQNVPNPFNPMTTISYVVPDGGGHVTVEVYDVSGRHVRTLVDEFQDQGAQSVDWDGADDSGTPMATGVYFYRMSGPGIEASRKMLLLK